MEAHEIRTDELHNHIGSEIFLPGRGWFKLADVQASKIQGWDIEVEDGNGRRETLQSCFAGTPFGIRSDAWAFGCSGDAARWIEANVGLD